MLLRIASGTFLGIAVVSALTLGSLSARAEERFFRVVGVEVAGAKIWLPSTLTVKKGDRVRITLENRAETKSTVLGFSIDEYKIRYGVTREARRIEFVAAKSGIFGIKSHLHPEHVPGELVVLE